VKKRWRLDAIPLPESHFNEKLAETINQHPDRFWIRRSARRAAKFYESRMYLPVRFVVVDEKKASDA
jgi:hypothetical protein